MILAIFPKRMSRVLSILNTDVTELFGGKKAVPLRDLAVFCRQTAFLLGAGLPVKEALPLVARNYDLHSRVLQGEGLAAALKGAGIFPTFMCAYVEIGERTAKLPEVFTRLADYFEIRARSREELTAAMLYPSIVTAMMFGVIVLAVTFVLPGYAHMFDSADVALPAATLALLRISGFLTANAAAVLFFLAMAIIAATIFLRSETGRYHTARVSIKLPVIRKIVNRNIAQGLSIFLASGQSIAEALPQCGEIVDNALARRDLQKVSAAVDSGSVFSEALAEIPYVQPLLISLARVGERTGTLPETIEKSNLYFNDICQREIRRINKLATPLVTLLTGALLAAIMLAVILPAFELAAII